jgi:hypothetical protein
MQRNYDFSGQTWTLPDNVNADILSASLFAANILRGLPRAHKSPINTGRRAQTSRL